MKNVPTDIYIALQKTVDDIYRDDRPIPGQPPEVPEIPEEGRGLDMLPALWAEITAGSTKLASPRMMGHMDTAPHPAAALTDAVVSALNNNLLFRELSPFASAVEEAVTREVARRLGLPSSAAGTFCSGGSLANLTALFAACGGFAEPVGRRDVRLFVPECAHTSIKKAAAVLGLDPGQTVPVPGDAQGRADPEALGRLLDDNPGTRNIVVAHLGSTVHGAVEAIDRIAEVVCAAGAWLHIDAIYGGALAFSRDHRGLLRGLERAHSVVVGPQKWMYVPRLCALVYLQNPEEFDRRLGMPMPYSASGEAHRGTWGLQGSRRADALTLWVTLQVLGARRLGTLVDDAIARTRRFHRMLAAHDVVAPTHGPDLNVQCIAYRSPGRSGDELRAVHARLTERGDPWVSLSQWRGRLALRSVILRPETGETEFARLLDAIAEVPRDRFRPPAS